MHIKVNIRIMVNFPPDFLYFPYEVCIALTMRKKDVIIKKKKRLKKPVHIRAHNPHCPGSATEGWAPKVGMLADLG